MTLSLRGVRILVVEDNYVLADALRFLLVGYEATITAITPSVEQAFVALREQPIDIAILDVNLGGRSVVPFADHLHTAGTPFLFVTGYGDDPDLLPAHLRDRPRLDKPADAERLVSTILRLAARG